MSARPQLPGPRSLEFAVRRAAAVPRGVSNASPLVAERAHGSVITDLDGNALIDFATGIGTLNVGATHPAVVEAARRAVGELTHACFHVTMYPAYVELAERLNALTPGGHAKKTVLLNTGAEGVENAVKIARHATGRPGVVTFRGAFHGRTLLAMSLTDKEMPYKHRFGPFAPDIHRLPYSYPYRCPTAADGRPCDETCAAEAVRQMREEIGPDQIACIVAEPIQGESGMIVPGDGFLPALREFAAAHGILYVSDEVQAGLGRTGELFATDHYDDFVPDLVVTAKALGGGLPIGAVTGTADVMDTVHVGGLGGTFGGNPVSCAAALAALDVIEQEDLLKRARRIGERMVARLEEYATRFEAIGEVRGRGALQAIEFVSDRDARTPDSPTTKKVLAACHQRGLVILGAGLHDNVIRLLPSLLIEEELLDEGLDILGEALEEVCG